MYTIPTISTVAAMPRAELIRQLVAKGRYAIPDLIECSDGVLCVRYLLHAAPPAIFLPFLREFARLNDLPANDARTTAICYELLEKSIQ